MTTIERPKAATGTDRAERSGSAQRAYDRRARREALVTGPAHPRLIRVGQPVRSALSKVPMVIAAIIVLGCGIAAVLTVNTFTDEVGLQINRTENSIADAKLRIEALEQQVADGNSTPENRGRGQPPRAGPGR